jgi:S-DNA-T family DNA segregation ATPase FtsK/SpoIIIE
MKTRRKRVTRRARRPTSRTRFKIRRIRVPSLKVPARQQRELAGLAGLLVAALIALAVYLPSGGGSAMQALRLGLDGLFGVGVIVVILAALAAGLELLAPWIESFTLGRGLGIVLLLGGVLGLLHLASAGSGGAVGRAETEALRGFLGTAGSLLVLTAVVLGALVLAFDLSLRDLAGLIRDRYEDAQQERRTALAERAVRGRPAIRMAGPVAQPPRDVEEPVLVPIQGLAAADPDPPARVAPRPTIVRPAPDGEPIKAPAQLEQEHAAAVMVVADEEDDEPPHEWRKPELSLLDTVTVRKERLQDEIVANIKTIEQTLLSFDVEAKVIGVNSGPAVTQYELQPAKGVAVRRITALQNDLSLALSATVRIQAPIPGRPAVGVEVPNKATSLVTLREIIQTPTFQDDKTLLSLAIGTDVSGNTVVGDLTRMPHLLIAGATGSGKSVCINALLAGLMFQATPDEMKLILIDPKRVEFSLYQDLPYLMVPVVTESDQAVASLRWAVMEMDNRYKLFASHTVRNIGDFNERAAEMGLRPLPYIVVVIDELADLMMVAAGEIEELICRIAQLARAVGIHLLVATQRPSADIITGLIKANIPSRIAFAVSSSIDSRVILDETGAEKLLGRGDMLYLPVEASKATRLQGVFVSEREIKGIVDFWRAQGKPQYQEEIFNVEATVSWAKEGTKRDPLFGKGARVVATEGRASVSLLQRKLNVGYTRAARIVDQLADQRVVGPYEGSKSREVLMNLLEVDDLVRDLEDS